MKNNTTEKTAYQQLREKLDDKDFARKFFDDKEAEAKELIYEILAVTLGWNVVTAKDNEWGHESIFRVLDLFTIRHENFDRSQLAENLQTHIFHYTMKHDDTYREWAKGWETEENYKDAESASFETPNQQPQPSDTARQLPTY